MAHIKKVHVKGIRWRRGGNRYGYYWDWMTFTTFTDDHGNKTYLVDNAECSKDDGNEKYIAFKKSNAEYQTTKDCEKFIKDEQKRYDKSQTKERKMYCLSPSETFQEEVEDYDVTYEELIEKLEGSIDKYVDFIDDYGQYRSACEANNEIRAKIKKLQTLIEER